VERATLIFDGDCALCRKSAEWIRARDTHSAFDYLPYQDATLQRRFPEISRRECERALHLVAADGQLTVGADALPDILSRLPRWRRVAPVLRLRALRPLSRWLYRRIARTRSRVSTSSECDLRP
jgi:predicted DCC family thiol-disulfide oxidoreductase YuxK